MSYLGGTRLAFAGRFQADVSTVNNDPAHFHNSAFQPGYQDMQGANMKSAERLVQSGRRRCIPTAWLSDRRRLAPLRPSRAQRPSSPVYSS